MSFAAWIVRETGLSLYDFRVLDRDGDSQREVRELFNQWLEECGANDFYREFGIIHNSVHEAMEDAMDEGFDLTIFN